MSSLIIGDASMAFTRGLVLFIWGVTPFCWTVVVARLAYLAAPQLLPASASARCSGDALSSHLCPSRHPWASTAFFAYCAIEAAFSIYYAHLARRIQRRGPPPLFGKRFLRGLLIKALETGLDKQPDQARSSSVDPRLRRRDAPSALSKPQTLEEEKASAEAARRRFGRLRSASFAPQFVHQPLEYDDPRALEFRDDWSKWFFGVDHGEITRRDALHWFAWSMFGTTLEEIEEEHERNKHKQQQPDGHADGNGSLAVNGGGEASGAVSAMPSPVPPSMARFGDLPPEVVQQEDVKGAMAQTGEWDPTKGDRLEFLNYCLDLVEARQGRAYATRGQRWKDDDDERSAERLRMMRLTVDPVRVVGRPLALYLVVNTLSMLVRRKAMRGGFRRETEGRLPYLIRVPEGWNGEDPDAPLPLIFLHGLGIGLAQYSSLIDRFLSDPAMRSRPILILLQPNISQALFSPDFLAPFGHHETTAAFRAILTRYRWDDCGVSILSNSYGSMVHSWLIQSLGEKVQRSMLVDPVCFRLWVPHVCGNFVYKRVESPVEVLMRYFVAREVGAAFTLCRSFQWASNLLWPDDIPNHTDPTRLRIVIAENDAIISAPSTLDYLIESGVPRTCILYGRGKVHGEMIMDGKEGGEFEQIVKWLGDM